MTLNQPKNQSILLRIASRNHLILAFFILLTCSQLLLIFLILLSAEIGSVRQHSENNPDKFMGCSKNSLFE